VERRGIFWLGVLAVLVILAFVTPYTVLYGVDRWYGAFLFWVLFALAAMGVNFAIVRRWKD